MHFHLWRSEYRTLALFSLEAIFSFTVPSACGQIRCNWRCNEMSSTAEREREKKEPCITSGDIASHRRQSRPCSGGYFHTEAHCSGDDCSISQTHATKSKTTAVAIRVTHASENARCGREKRINHNQEIHPITAEAVSSPGSIKHLRGNYTLPLLVF